MKNLFSSQCSIRSAMQQAHIEAEQERAGNERKRDAYYDRLGELMENSLPCGIKGPKT